MKIEHHYNLQIAYAVNNEGVFMGLMQRTYIAYYNFAWARQTFGV